ncbi:MAG: hypothetical protein DLM50_04550 [Candidatus Meridianibacter frigidus]|nr:MAG: hypothetical protein DLM50_04550 [Candidatus Eremiobacteraeota bacterium]
MRKTSPWLEQVPVARPFRLDLTVNALRRLSTNIVDVVGEDGTYRRVLERGHNCALLSVRQLSADLVEIRIQGANAEKFSGVAQRMLGLQRDLRSWERHAAGVPWVARLARALRGLKPPRYPTLWEALAHAIIFQQISIHAASAIMRRTIEALAQPVRGLYPFPTPQQIWDAPQSVLVTAGLSANKVASLRAAAAAILAGVIDEAALERLDSESAIGMLTALRGIGPWSAAVVLLRGLGRLDVFPRKDSGVAAAIALLSDGTEEDPEGLPARLGPQRGMLYFHLLLGKLARVENPLQPRVGYE